MITKPEKGRQVEAMLCQMAQSGQMAGKMDDAALKDLLNRFAANQPSSKVKFDRRRAALDSDEDWAKQGDASQQESTYGKLSFRVHEMS